MSEKKDVLFLCQYFYPEYISSATLPYDTAISLVESGISVDVLTGYPKEYNLKTEVPIKETHRNIRIKRIKYLQLERANFVGRLVNYFSFTFSMLLKINSLKHYKSIIVYSNPPILPLIAAISKKIFKTKVIFVSYDIYPEIAIHSNVLSEKSVITKMMRLINKFVFKNVNKVIALSDEMKQFLLKNRPLFNKDIDIIPNWYDDKGKALTFNKNEIDNEKFYFLKTKKFIVSYFGNMGVCQDIDTIVGAMVKHKNNKDIHFLFAGHGTKVESLIQTIKENGLTNATVFDFLHGQDYTDALNISDAFIVSLEKNITGLAVPSKTYAYMMSGKPVLAIMEEQSDISQDLIRHSAGYAIEPGDSTQLYNAIYNLSLDSDKCQVMGDNCRNIYLEKYTTKKCTMQYVSMINKLLEEQ
ncbi:glycosyltransferase family 4 protein [Bacillus zanthoxyli]|nr:glycosyltransferase family 4 protein [Bacillus zanthoxyli]